MSWRDRFRKQKPERGLSSSEQLAPPGDTSAEPATTKAKQDTGATVLRGNDATPEPQPTIPKAPLKSASISIGDVVADTSEI